MGLLPKQSLSLAKLGRKQPVAEVCLRLVQTNLLSGGLLFGRRLPEVGRSLGKAIKGFQRGVTEEPEEEVAEIPEDTAPEAEEGGERPVEDPARSSSTS